LTNEFAKITSPCNVVVVVVSFSYFPLASKCSFALPSALEVSWHNSGGVFPDLQSHLFSFSYYIKQESRHAGFFFGTKKKAGNSLHTFFLQSLKQTKVFF